MGCGKTTRRKKSADVTLEINLRCQWYSLNCFLASLSIWYASSRQMFIFGCCGIGLNFYDHSSHHCFCPQNLRWSGKMFILNHLRGRFEDFFITSPNYFRMPRNVGKLRIFIGMCGKNWSYMDLRGLFFESRKFSQNQIFSFFLINSSRAKNFWF